MRIGFYIHHSMLKAGGIFTYSIGILRLLLKSDKISSVVIFTTPEVKEILKEFESESKTEFILLDRNRKLNSLRLYLSHFLFDTYTIYNHYSPDSRIIRLIKKTSILLNPYKNLIENSGVNIFHVPLQYSPIYGIKIPVLITMHDLQELHMPENFSSEERIHRAINNYKAITESDKIIVSFNHIKKDILHFFKTDERKISVCPPPFSENWFTTGKESNWQSLEKKYSISKDYLLYPAATWPHKNHIRLLEALKIVKEKFPNLKLICTGNKTDYYAVIEKKINELNIGDSVKFLGIVPEEDLIGLYKNANLVVIPTLYEAGSGPLYEAMRYAVPVICAKTTSLPETINNEKFIFEPLYVYSISELIMKLLSDEKLKNENVKNSINRMEVLSNHNYSEAFNLLYEGIVNKD